MLHTTLTKATVPGNGAATIFAFPFRVLQAADLKVFRRAPNGAMTPLVLDVDYGVTGVGDAGGGAVAYPLSGPPLGSGWSLTIARVVPLTQNTVLTNGGPFHAAAVEQMVDRVVMMAQQLGEQAERVLTAPLTDDGPPLELPGAGARAGRLLGFDDAGRPIAVDAGDVGGNDGGGNGGDGDSALGVLIAEAGPVISNGALTEMDVGVPLQDARHIDLTVGGVAQRGVFTISGSRVIFPAPAPEGAAVNIRVYAGGEEVSGDLAWRRRLHIDASAGPVTLDNIAPGQEALVRKIDASANPVHVVSVFALSTEDGFLLTDEAGGALEGAQPPWGGAIVLTAQYDHVLVENIGGRLFRI